MTYYPSCLNQHEYCELCNYVQQPSSACTSTSSDNGGDHNIQPCSTFCDSGCNSSCDTAQTVCIVHNQYIKNHADVGGYNGSTSIAPNDFIHLVWTADYWNTLISKLNTAENVGRESSHGSGGSVSAGIGAPYFQSADLYNQVSRKIQNFNTSCPEVNQNDLITATLANAIGNAYNDATFDSSVCDMCNTDQTVRGGCGCNCPCPCSCDCGCDCPCDCSCDCSCGPSCSCNDPKS